MTVTRLRPLPDLDAFYGDPHDPAGHDGRIRRTIEFAAAHVPPGASLADLSCGTGEIALALADAPVLGDYSAGWPIRGRIEETAVDVDPVDVWVLTETLEHLDDPGRVLGLVRERAGLLVLSTPVGQFEDSNGEHCWAWDREGVESLLGAAGWTVVEFCELAGWPYCYGLWVAM